MRPVHELGACVVFAPAEARLFRLNPHAWLVLELCRAGPTREALRAAYAEAVVPPLAESEVDEALRAATDLLLRHRLLEIRDGLPAPARPDGAKGTA